MAIIRNTQTDIPYRYLGEDKYRNLVTRQEGVIKPELAQKIFKINLEATAICEEYPLVEELIFRLKMKLDKGLVDLDGGSEK